MLHIIDITEVHLTILKAHSHSKCDGLSLGKLRKLDYEAEKMENVWEVEYLI